MRKVQPGFTEKTFGYGGFLQFAKAAATQGVVTLAWDDEADDYVLTVPDRGEPAPPETSMWRGAWAAASPSSRPASP